MDAPSTLNLIENIRKAARKLPFEQRADLIELQCDQHQLSQEVQQLLIADALKDSTSFDDDSNRRANFETSAESQYAADLTDRDSSELNPVSERIGDRVLMASSDVPDLAPTIDSHKLLAEESQTVGAFAEPATLPMRVDNYELLELLGRGGMGDVFLARHHRFRDRRYAVKLMKSGLFDADAVQRFELEISATGSLEHPNIVHAADAGTFAGAPYLVMEYVPGVDLQGLVEEVGPIGAPEAALLTLMAARGLQHAYESGIIHRDIKPGNLILANDGHLKLLDMGLARFREQQEEGELTREGQFLGTPDYMAPEQWNDSHSSSTQADIYSLGCTIYCLLTGKPPFAGLEKRSVVKKMKAHLMEPVPDLRREAADIPVELAEVVAKCMAKEAQNRFQSPAELAAALTPLANAADLQPLLELAHERSVGTATPFQRQRPTASIKAVSHETVREAVVKTDQAPKWGCSINIAISLCLMTLISVFAISFFSKGIGSAKNQLADNRATMEPVEQADPGGHEQSEPKARMQLDQLEKRADPSPDESLGQESDLQLKRSLADLKSFEVVERFELALSPTKSTTPVPIEQGSVPENISSAAIGLELSEPRFARMIWCDANGEPKELELFVAGAEHSGGRVLNGWDAKPIAWPGSSSEGWETVLILLSNSELEIDIERFEFSPETAQAVENPESNSQGASVALFYADSEASPKQLDRFGLSILNRERARLVGIGSQPHQLPSDLLERIEDLRGRCTVFALRIPHPATPK